MAESSYRPDSKTGFARDMFVAVVNHINPTYNVFAADGDIRTENLEKLFTWCLDSVEKAYKKFEAV